LVDLGLPSFEPSFHVLTPGDLLEAVWGVIHSVTALNPWIMLGSIKSKEESHAPKANINLP
jgi:hypothetical protein